MNDNEQKWIDQLKHEHGLYKKHLKVYEDEILEYKEAARSEAEEVNRLQAENKKLRDALLECPIVGETHRDSNDRFKEWNLIHRKTLEALKEVEE
jgi:regulator of replication initiation timing